MARNPAASASSSADVVVVGGGVAGSAAAILLAGSAAQRIVVMDSGRSMTQRVGESIPPDAGVLLRRLGVWEDFLRQGHASCTGSCSAWGSEVPGYNDFVLNPHGYGWHLDRRAFDALLAQRATQAGARRVFSARVSLCQPLSGGGFRISFTKADGASSIIEAGAVIDASGAGSIVARQLGAKRLWHDRIAFVYGFAQAPTVQAQRWRMTMVEAVPNGWWYLAALPDNRVAVALATDSELLRKHKLHCREQWIGALLRTQHVAPQLDGCRLSDEPLSVHMAPSFRLDHVAGNGWLAIGDAAAAYDPISSQGIYKALSEGIRTASESDVLTGGSAAADRINLRAMQEFDQYLSNRSYLYALEQRWPEALFWRRRYERISATTAASPGALRAEDREDQA